MCGSGTVCKVAHQLNRNFIGIDISLEYCEIARTRIGTASELQMQLPLEAANNSLQPTLAPRLFQEIELF